MQMCLTSHTTVNTRRTVQLAYHKLYNRPASPLSCLCSSSCSSPLLNENKSGDVDSLQWEIKSINLRSHWVWFVRGLAGRELLPLACAAGRLAGRTLIPCWPGWPCCPPSPSHLKLYTDRGAPTPPPRSAPVCSVRELVVSCTHKFWKPPQSCST